MLFSTVAIFSSAVLSATIPSHWNQTVTNRGIPAYKDITSPSYIPSAIRDKELGLTQSKRATGSTGTSSGLQWAANFSDQRLQMTEEAVKHVTCDQQTCYPDFSFTPAFFTQIVDQLTSKCGDMGCINGFDITVGNYNVHVFVNAKYSANKANYVSAIHELVQGISTSNSENLYYDRGYFNGRCLGLACRDRLTITTSKAYSFALYHQNDGTPSGGGFHSNMDIEFEATEKLQPADTRCQDVTAIVSKLVGVANKLFGAIASAGSPILCKLLSS